MIVSLPYFLFHLISGIVFLVPVNTRPSDPPLLTPYLQAVTATGISVMVESRSVDPVTVEYGTSEKFGKTARTTDMRMTTGQTYMHCIRLTGLTPRTMYHYRVRRGKEMSDPAAFTTAPTGNEPVHFAWFSDSRSGTAIHDSIAALILKAKPAVSLYGGDLCGSSTYSSYRLEFFRPPQMALIARVPFFNAVGNHESWSTNTKAFTRAPASDSGTEDYYSFDYGPMHVLVLNTEIARAPGSDQYLFAQRDLSKTLKPWKVVIAHKPAYCAGGHGEESDLKRMSAEVFVPNRVDVYLAGHSHFYQHNLVDGIRHLVIGAAGAPLYTPKSAPYTVKSAKEYNFAIGDADSLRFRLIVYNHRGAVLDSIVLTKKAMDPGRSE